MMMPAAMLKTPSTMRAARAGTWAEIPTPISVTPCAMK